MAKLAGIIWMLLKVVIGLYIINQSFMFISLFDIQDAFTHSLVIFLGGLLLLISAFIGHSRKQKIRKFLGEEIN